MFQFRPSVIRVPTGPVRFRMTSPDVIHGFQIVGTNANVTVTPGYVSEFSINFDAPGEYLIVCNEFCGLSHHLMQGKLIVGNDEQTRRPAGVATPREAAP
jgi:cytochrome c oxidase subunit 2